MIKMYGITEPLGLLENLVLNSSNWYEEAGIYRLKTEYALYGRYTLSTGTPAERFYRWVSPRWERVHTHIHWGEPLQLQKETWIAGWNPVLIQYGGKKR